MRLWPFMPMCWSVFDKINCMKRFVVLIFCIFALISCRDNQDEVFPEPEVLLRDSAEIMRQTDGFHFMIDRDGELAYLDPGETLAFGSGEGDYVAPDKARAAVKIIAPGLVTTVSVISVGEIQWETNVLTGQWTELPPDWGFNPTVIFDPDVGLQKILEEDTSNLVTEGKKRVDGQELWHITGDVKGENVHVMAGGLIDAEPLGFETYIDPDTYQLVRAVVIDPPNEADDEPTTWQIDFSEFGTIVEIEPPQK